LPPPASAARRRWPAGRARFPPADQVRVLADFERYAAGVTSPPDDPGLVRLTAWADGRVQGVGFRAWVRMKANRLGLTGSATNLDDGRVEVVAEGPEQRVRALLAELNGGDAPGRVTRVTERWGHPQGRLRGFTEH
jgi:acylphosphatase